jgi:hypothetical protein
MNKERVEESSECLSGPSTFDKAREMVGEVQASETCRAIMLTYDPEKQKFQFIVMQADHEEVFELLINGMQALKSVMQDTSSDRTLN